jgi:hypothetical protein
MNWKEILKGYDQSSISFDENEIGAKLREITTEDEPEKLQAEVIAFSFHENHPKKTNPFQTYFGPQWMMSNGDGTANVFPALSQVNEEMLIYWEDRASKVNSPILKARYLGLIWDFYTKVTGKKTKIDIGKLYVQSLLEVSKSHLYKRSVYVYPKLQRALELSLQFNDKNLIEQTKHAIINFENKFAEDSREGLWGYAFDLLVENKKVALTNEEENQIISGLEEKLKLIGSPEDGKLRPWFAERAVDRLAVYYRRLNKGNEILRVIKELEMMYRGLFLSSGAMQIQSHLTKLHSMYQKFHLKEEAGRILVELRKQSPSVNDEMGTISHESSIPADVVERHIQELTAGNIQEVLSKWAHNFLPLRKDVESQVVNISKTAPTKFMFVTVIFDKKGRAVARVPGLPEGLEGHIFLEGQRIIQFKFLFFSQIFIRAKEHLSLTIVDVLEFLKGSAFEEDRVPIIEKALNCYFEADIIGWCHLIIPQLEECLRNMLEKSGGNVLKDMGEGRFQLRTLDDILRDGVLLEILGEDVTFYLRLVLTDQRGFNIRNDVSHGLGSTHYFNHSTANVLFHVLLCIGLFKEVKI